MQAKIIGNPSSQMVRITLEPNETVFAESSSFVGMSYGVQIATRLQGGILRSYPISIISYRALEQGGSVLLASRSPGEIFPHQLSRGNRPVLVQLYSFLASEERVKIDPVLKGGGAFQAQGSLPFLRCSGVGQLFMGAFGSIHLIDLQEDENFIINCSHLVAFEEIVQIRMRDLGGLQRTSIPDDQIAELIGPGFVYLQSRHKTGLLLESR